MIFPPETLPEARFGPKQGLARSKVWPEARFGPKQVLSCRRYGRRYEQGKIQRSNGGLIKPAAVAATS
jgi:hypothetical protein